jgi:non-heme chloroperoxidase
MRDRVDLEKVLRRYRPAAPRPALRARIASSANSGIASRQPHQERSVMKHHTITGGDEVQLHVVETGNPGGRPILFIHGLSQCWLAWGRQLNSDLADRYRLVAMDMRGHGLSEKPRDGYDDSRLWADDVDAVLRALTLDRPILCGWSYGPLVILDYVRHYGEEALGAMTFVDGITKLGSEEAASVLTPEFLNLVPGFFSTDVEQSTQSLQSLLRLCFAEEPATEDLYLMLGYNVAVPPYVRQALLSRSFDNDDLLPTLRKPVLIVHGDRDAAVKPAVVDQHRASLSHAEVAVMPNVAHAPFWDDAPAFNGRLRTFCERLERQAAS